MTSPDTAARSAAQRVTTAAQIAVDEEGAPLTEMKVGLQLISNSTAETDAIVSLLKANPYAAAKIENVLSDLFNQVHPAAPLVDALEAGAVEIHAAEAQIEAVHGIVDSAPASLLDHQRNALASRIEETLTGHDTALRQLLALDGDAREQLHTDLTDLGVAELRGQFPLISELANVRPSEELVLAGSGAIGLS